MKIVTHCVCPPIPIRTMDWVAYDEDTYDADWQGEERGFVSDNPVGYGATEQEAIDDLMAQLEEDR